MSTISPRLTLEEAATEAGCEEGGARSALSNVSPERVARPATKA